jgi:REP element-mobilizing transposase RayT
MKQDIIELGTTYHIFNRGNNKENIFIELKNYSYFLDLLKKHIVPIADVYAYCLLKNHFHLLLRIKDEKEISPRFKEKPYLAFSNMFNAYTKAINKKYARSGSLFQEHLNRRRIMDEKHLIQVLAYIHLNPVKHGFTEDFKTYSFSSFKAYITNKNSNIDKQTIFALIDEKSFEYWHHQRIIGLEDIMDL